MRACWLKWVGRDWSISADYIWLNYSGANNTNYGGNDDWQHSRILTIYTTNVFSGVGGIDAAR